MKKFIAFIILFFSIFLFSLNLFSEIKVKIKDLSYVDGLKDNQIYGYGLVVGLPGTGDSKTPLAKSSLKSILKTLGLNIENFKSKNMAAVLLTGKLPAFVRVGDKIDITVSSIGDCKSLVGGVLIQSPLIGADNKIYVVVQGPLSSFSGKKRKGVVKTVAVIPQGGIIERNIIPNILKNNSFYVVLKEPDYTVASEILKVVLKKYPNSKPKLTDNGKIKISYSNKKISLAEFVSTILELEVKPGDRARVVIDERNGTIVTGGNVKISRAMVSKDGVVVEIGDDDKKVSSSYIKDSSTVKDLVDALNAIGAKTSDLISILKALKAAGSLHAELIIK